MDGTWKLWMVVVKMLWIRRRTGDGIIALYLSSHAIWTIAIITTHFS